MNKVCFPGLTIAALLLGGSLFPQAQTLSPVAKFPLSHGPLRIQRSVQPRYPFTVAGERGAILGEQNGRFELWSLPIKVLNNFRITAELEGYGVPLDLNRNAAEIEVLPDHTTITYSHSAIVVKQHMFAPQGEASKSANAIVFFEISSVLPATITFSFEPALAQQWPAPGYGRPGVSWVGLPGGGGGYMLATENPKIFGLIAMPGAKPGVEASYQERPEAHPLELKLAFDPKRDSGSYFPLLVALPDGKTNRSQELDEQLKQRVVEENRNLAEIYREAQEHYSHFFDSRLVTETPDSKFDEAIRWAEIAIDQTKVRHGDELGLVAGWYPAWDSNRPGFGWYFGRDTLWTLYAIHSYGDKDLAKHALEFLLKRQRTDGKIMHEYSQTADLVNWEALPYEYAAADSTPLFLMAMEDYLRATGDKDFIKQHWEALKKAYAFDRANDTDGDGVFDNSQGTGWVEAWPPKMPHQEVYLAALDFEGTESFSHLASILGESALAKQAAEQAKLIRNRLDAYRTSSGMYAFSKEKDGSYDPTPTIFSSVAWWNRGSGLKDADAMFSSWASHHFSTDWGTRSVADTAKVYNPISYHQGSVWPLFTGWTALSEYRTGRSLAGYSHLMQNAALTWTQDPGYATEVISGEFFEPLGRSSSHQLWSSAMILTPAIRGLFGIEVDALRRNISLDPHLPVQWNNATVRHVSVGDAMLDIHFERKGKQLLVDAVSEKESVLCFNLAEEKSCGEKPQMHHRIALSLPVIEVGVDAPNLIAGEQTQGLKVLSQVTEGDRVTLQLEAPAGSVQSLYLRNNGVKSIVLDGAEVRGVHETISFPGGSGYQTKTVVISSKGN